MSLKGLKEMKRVWSGHLLVKLPRLKSSYIGKWSEQMYFNDFLTECLCLVAQVVWCAGKANHCWGGMLFLFLDQWFASQNGEEGTLTHSLHVRVEFLGRDFMQVYFFARTSQHGRCVIWWSRCRWGCGALPERWLVVARCRVCLTWLALGLVESGSR